MSVADPLADQRVYETGARFVRYLLTLYGHRPFLQFYSRLTQRSTFGDLDRAMRDVFDVKAEVAWAAALATSPNCPRPFECSREKIPLDGSPTEVLPTCGLADDVRTFDLADEQVVITGSDSLHVGSCDPIPFSTIRVTGEGTADEQIGLMQLSGGHYYLSIRGSRPTTLQATAATAPWAGVDCAALASLVLPAGLHADLRVSVSAIPPNWMVKLRFEESRQLTLRWPADATLSVCGDCSQSSCRTLSAQNRRWYVSSPGDYVVRLQAPSSTDVTVLDVLGD
jgi:hypothetical protein